MDIIKNILLIPSFGKSEIVIEETWKKIFEVFERIEDKWHYTDKDFKIASFYKWLSNWFIFPMSDLLEKEYSSFLEFYNNLINIFKVDILQFYEKELNKNNWLHDLSKNEIKKHINILENNLLINDYFLRDINNLEEFDFRNFKEENLYKESLLKEINSKYEITVNTITTLFDNVLSETIKNLNLFFIADKSNIKTNSESEHFFDKETWKKYKELGLDSSKEYYNIYLFIHIFNKKDIKNEYYFN